MAKAIKVELDSSGVGEVLRSAAVRRELARIADRVAQAARATAPVDTGAYQDSIHVESVTTDRAVARVVASDWKSAVLEARTGNLARALGQAGG